MSIVRVNKTKDFTVMSNYHLRDNRLTLKAKGLLSLMLSLPENWNYSIGGLVAICIESESAVKTALNELKKSGYVVVTKLPPSKTKSGRYEYIYDVYEQSRYDIQEVEKQEVENQPLENQQLENCTLYKRTYESNTDNKNINNRNTDDKKTASRFVPPSLEEVKAYAIKRNANIDCEYFIDYYNSNGWVVGKSKMKDWKATFRNWERRQGGSKSNQQSKPKAEPVKQPETEEEICKALGVW